MLDSKRIREATADVLAALNRRGEDFGAAVEELIERDEERREALTEVNELKAQRNAVSKEVGERRRAGEGADELIARMRDVGEAITGLDQRIAAAECRLRELLLELPNTPLDEVPSGGEEANRIVATWGEPRTFDFTPRPHWELGESLGILDLARGAKISGSGFPVLRGAGARLQRALITFFLDRHTREHGYEEVRVPYLVTRDTLTGTGQLPKFADESYLAERDDLWLIPTAEVPVTNLHRDELLDAADLPRRYVTCSPCFRREAGAAGKDTRGLLRVHQFDKVELVRIEAAPDGRAALDELTRHAEVLLELLGLPYRRVVLATGDLGFSSALTYDLEVWSPGVERWLEVSSCSTCTDYQARRANIRYRPSPGDRPEYVHTLNGSGLALPRVLAALLETGQEADGSVTIPEVLRPLFGDERIRAPERS